MKYSRLKISFFICASVLVIISIAYAIIYLLPKNATTVQDKNCIIVYYSLTGNTERLAYSLSDILKKDYSVKVENVDSLTSKGVFDLSSYDLIAFGSGVYFREFSPEMREYIKNVSGLETKEVHPDARKVFEHGIRDIETRAGKKFLEETFDMNSHSLGDSEAEKKYRQWCLYNQLFINPLNDLGPYNIAAQDILSCPSLYTSKDETLPYPPVYFGFYNQLKQEYVSARYLFYESLQSQAPHYSDSDVQLYNTLDYPCYGLNTEKAKIAFRMVYSIFDKMAYFINEYLQLRAPKAKVSFKTIWYGKQKKSEGLRKEFVDFENWPLRGLFWLAKDLSENRQEFRKSIEPDAKNLVGMRNHLEHRYLTMTEYDMSDIDEFADSTQRGFYRITRNSFSLKTLKLFKLVRAALIYLSLGIHVEERKKRSKVDGIIAPMPLDIWEDDWKT